MSNAKKDTPSKLALTSSVFAHGQPIPRKHTGDGLDSSPPLTWHGIPEGTQSLALICDDPDAPSPQPWVHWVIFNLPRERTGLPEGIRRSPRLDEPSGAVQGKNSWPTDNIRYRGPAPPPGHGVHHYHFKLYALDAMLNLPSGVDKTALLEAMGGHVLDEAELVGLYQRS